MSIHLYIFKPEELVPLDESMSVGQRNRQISLAAYDKAASLAASVYSVSGLTIKKTERGKPYFDESDIHMSISHCREAVVIALAEHEIGVDAESLRPFKPYALSRLFSENEMRYISSDETRRAIELWTLREAISKAYGDGFTDWYFHAGLVTDDGERTLPCCQYKGISYFLSVFDFDNYILSIACTVNDDILIHKKEEE